MCSVKGWPTVTLEGFAARVGCTVELGGAIGAGTGGAGTGGGITSTVTESVPPASFKVKTFRPTGKFDMTIASSPF